MTEQEWLACADPTLMLEHLWTGGEASDRKLRLFAVACCRRLAHLPTDERSQLALAISERFADGLATPTELDEAYERANVVIEDMWNASNNSWDVETTAFAARDACWVEGQDGVVYATSISQSLVRFARLLTPLTTRKTAQKVERRTQCRILRDLFGPRLFRPVALDPTWGTWENGTIVKLAKVIYDERAFGHLPILTDALEEAGCTNADILDHLRGQGPHVRGCWPLDLLLRKE